MANDVYTIAHSGLSSLVSARAATQVLNKALRHKGHTADTISREQMRDVLLGPVLRELEGILPRDGVERNLKQILGELRNRSRVAVAVEEASQPITDKATIAEAEHAIINLQEETADARGAEGYPTELDLLSAEPSQAALEPPALSDKEAEASPLQRKLIRIDDAAQLEPVVLQFAQLEHVKMVAAMRSNGEIVLSRGSGYDLNALARLGAMGLKLLGRGGEIRSYYLGHERAQLFVLPVGDYALIVIGTDELNLGGVFATLSVLEEEL